MPLLTKGGMFPQLQQLSYTWLYYYPKLSHPLSGSISTWANWKQKKVTGRKSSVVPENIKWLFVGINILETHTIYWQTVHAQHSSDCIGKENETAEGQKGPTIFYRLLQLQLTATLKNLARVNGFAPEEYLEVQINSSLEHTADLNGLKWYHYFKVIRF